jgi:hypothetical protein
MHEAHVTFSKQKATETIQHAMNNSQHERHATTTLAERPTDLRLAALRWRLWAVASPRDCHGAAAA